MFNQKIPEERNLPQLRLCSVRGDIVGLMVEY